MTFTQSAGAFSGLTATDLAVKKPRSWWKKRLAMAGLSTAKLNPQSAPTGHIRGPVARKRTNDMTQFEKMVAALKTSVTETIAAGLPNRDEQLAQSFDQFAESLTKAVTAQGEALAKRAPDLSGLDHVARLGEAVNHAAEAVRAIEAGETHFNEGMAAADPDKITLAKAGVDLLAGVVQLMAVEQAAPMEEGEDPTQEGLGLAKVALGGEELMVKHALSEPAMEWLADPEVVRAQAIDAGIEALVLLGVDVRPLFKAAEEEGEEGEDGEGEFDGEGEGEDEELDGEDEGGDEGEDAMSSSDSPLVDLARLGTMTMLLVDQIKEQAAADGVAEQEMAALDAIGQMGAFVTVQADQLAQAAMGPGSQEEGEEEEMAEEEMALAAKSAELAKAARERLGLVPAESLAKSAPASAPQTPAAPAAPAANLPMLKTVGVGKVTDQGGTEAETPEELAKRLAQQPMEKTQQELIKMALNPAKAVPLALS